jgi:hypothetical protein
MHDPIGLYQSSWVGSKTKFTSIITTKFNISFFIVPTFILELCFQVRKSSIAKRNINYKNKSFFKTKVELPKTNMES